MNSSASVKTTSTPICFGNIRLDSDSSVVSNFDIESLNAAAFLGLARKHKLDIFGCRLGYSFAPGSDRPQISIRSVLTEKTYATSSCPLDDRGVP